MLSVTNSLLAMTALFNLGLMVLILRGSGGKPTNLFFSIFLSALSLWALALIGFELALSDQLALIFGKITYAAALTVGMSFYLFSIAFPEESMPSKYTLSITICSSILYILALFIPSFLARSLHVYSWGRQIELGIPEYLLFAFMFVSFYVGGLIRTWTKYFYAKGITRLQLLVISLSVTITGLGGMYYNLVLASPFLRDYSYLWTGPLFTTSIAVLITYSVFRLKLFNAKVIVTELLISLLWIVTFLRTMLAVDRQEQLFNALLFFLSLIIGALLIRSVRREVAQRELIQKQEQELEVVNHQQEGLLHFISHEVKGYLTKNEAGFAAITEGDYGAVSEPLKTMAASALVDTRRGVETVMDILDASNLKKGTVAYDKKAFNLSSAIQDVVNSLKPMAQEKRISLEYTNGTGGPATINGDENKLRRHVIRNLIDNSIRYTPSGNVSVELTKNGSALRMTVTDTGVGISPEDMQKLFTEGGHGSDSIKVNVHSTGYGLYIAKSIVEAHGGKIWAESDGKARGSRFIVELPAV
ncbi:MAG: ATP-binding protein [bacterium]|nr:ATP-binding protein [bacterium]